MLVHVRSPYYYFLPYNVGNNRQALHKQLCEAIHQMEVSEVLSSVQDDYCEDFYKYYLHDFVRNVHKSQNKKQEQAEAEHSVSICYVQQVSKCASLVSKLLQFFSVTLKN